MNLTAGRPHASQLLLACCTLLLPLGALGRPESASVSSPVTAANNNSTKVSAGNEPTMQINAKTNTNGGQNGTTPDWAASAEWPQSERPLEPAAQSRRPHYKLPSWFNHNAFKQLHGKRYESRFSNELHKRIYLETALKVFHQRALYRAGRLSSLASVNELSDLTGEQLDEFRERHRKQSAATETDTRPARDGGPTTAGPAGKRRGRPADKLPECCSYDQVYANIIRLLKSATDSNDTALSRALVDELEQRALVGEPEASGVGADFRALAKGPRDKAQQARVEEEEGEAERGDDEGKRAVAMLLDEQIATIRSNTLQQQQQQQQQQQLRQQTSWPAVGPAFGSRQKTYHQPAAHSGEPSGALSSGQQQQPVGGARVQAQAAPEVVSDGQWRAGRPRANSSSAANRSAGGESELSRQTGEAVLAQIAGQLDPSSPSGREINKLLSAHLGQPVELRARLLRGAAASDKTAAGRSA